MALRAGVMSVHPAGLAGRDPRTGDAFWSGFLFAYIKEKPIENCLEVALQLAALKLQNVGRLPDNINILSELL